MPFLRIDDINLHYEITGEGEPLLFIHGLGSSGRDWEKQIDFFSRRYRVAVFDVRGHGQSSRPPGPYSIKLFAADTAKLIETLLVPPIHVVGLSLGGMIAFQLAVDRPELMKSMVIVNIGPEVRLNSLKQFLTAIRRFAIVHFFGMKKMGEVLSRELFPQAEQASIRKNFVERWAKNDKQAYLDTMRAIVGWSVADRIDRIEVPTLVITSDHDYTSVPVKEAFVARMPRAELAVIRDAHHAVPVECPEAFNAVLTTFLARQR
jgi:pimeloyl-ACP methyl ester carboxylesterase